MHAISGVAHPCTMSPSTTIAPIAPNDTHAPSDARAITGRHEDDDDDQDNRLNAIEDLTSAAAAGGGAGSGDSGGGRGHPRTDDRGNPRMIMPHRQSQYSQEVEKALALVDECIAMSESAPALRSAVPLLITPSTDHVDIADVLKAESIIHARDTSPLDTVVLATSARDVSVLRALRAAVPAHIAAVPCGPSGMPIGHKLAVLACMTPPLDDVCVSATLPNLEARAAQRGATIAHSEFGVPARTIPNLRLITYGTGFPQMEAMIATALMMLCDDDRWAALCSEFRASSLVRNAQHNAGGICKVAGIRPPAIDRVAVCIVPRLFVEAWKQCAIDVASHSRPGACDIFAGETASLYQLSLPRSRPAIWIGAASSSEVSAALFMRAPYRAMAILAFEDGCMPRSKDRFNIAGPAPAAAIFMLRCTPDGMKRCTSNPNHPLTRALGGRGIDSFRKPKSTPRDIQVGLDAWCVMTLMSPPASLRHIVMRSNAERVPKSIDVHVTRASQARANSPKPEDLALIVHTITNSEPVAAHVATIRAEKGAADSSMADLVACLRSVPADIMNAATGRLVQNLDDLMNTSLTCPITIERPENPAVMSCCTTIVDAGAIARALNARAECPMCRTRAPVAVHIPAKRKLGDADGSIAMCIRDLSTANYSRIETLDRVVQAAIAHGAARSTPARIIILAGATHFGWDTAVRMVKSRCASVLAVSCGNANCIPTFVQKYNSTHPSPLAIFVYASGAPHEPYGAPYGGVGICTTNTILIVDKCTQSMIAQAILTCGRGEARIVDMRE